MLIVDGCGCICWNLEEHNGISAIFDDFENIEIRINRKDSK